MDDAGITNTHLQLVEEDEDVLRHRQDDGRRVSGDTRQRVSDRQRFQNDSRRQSERNSKEASVAVSNTLTLNDYSDALQESIDGNVPWGLMVDPHTAQELADKNIKCYLSDDGLCGVAVEPDGNITGVFKNKESSYKKAVYDLIITAIANGGNKLDCYVADKDYNLGTMYARLGFVPVARMDFNREYAKPNWDYDMLGIPDVVFWYHNGDSIETIINKFDNGGYKLYSAEELKQLKTFDDYEEALDYRDKKLSESRKNIKDSLDVDYYKAKNSDTTQAYKLLKENFDIVNKYRFTAQDINRISIDLRAKSKMDILCFRTSDFYVEVKIKSLYELAKK